MSNVRYKDTDTSCLANFDCFREWYDGDGDKREGLRRVMTLTRENSSHMKKLFGKCQYFDSFVRYRVWRVEHPNGVVIWALCSVKGMGVEIDMGHETAPDKIVGAVSDLYEKLKAPWEPKV